MARTSAKAKKLKPDVNKNKTDSLKKRASQENESDSEDANTDKENDKLKCKVEKIVHTRDYHGKRQYLVRWKGYKEVSDTWENESVVQSCTEALEKFEEDNTKLIKKNKEKDSKNAEVKKEDEADGEVAFDELSEIKSKVRHVKSPSKKLVLNKTHKKPQLSSLDLEESEKELQKNEKDRGKKRKSEINTKDTITNIVQSKIIKKDSDDKGSKGKTSFKGSKKILGSSSKQDGPSDDESVTDGTNYEVDKIIEVHLRKDGKREFLVRWMGYKPNDDTWEPEAHLNCPDLIKKFMEKVEKAKSIPARELRESRHQNLFISTFKVNKRGSRTLRNAGFRPNYQE